MATGKRYYWIKLKDSFMTSDTVDYLMSLPDGANYVVLYQMLCLKTINTGGRLSRQIGEIIIPFDVEKIQRDCKWFTIDTIRIALGLFKQFGLIYEDIDGTLVMADHDNLVGSESDYTERNRRLANEKAKKLSACVLNQYSNEYTNQCENGYIDTRDKEIKRLDTRYESIDTKKPRDTTTSTTVDEVEEFDDLYSKDWKRVTDTYQKEIGTLPTGTALEKFGSYIEDLGADAVIVAIKRTNEAQPRVPWTYLKRILDSFADKHVHSEDDAIAACNDFDREMRLKYQGSGRNGARTNQRQDAVNRGDTPDKPKQTCPWEVIL